MKCVNEIPVSITITQENELIKKKGLFWPTVLEGCLGHATWS